MQKRPVFAALAAAALAGISPALADEAAVTLKDAPGRDAVVNACAACHSLDYIQMNSPFPDAKMWDAEVTKMIKVFGAEIPPEDVKTIVEYLKANYGS